jgi:hypothetical protein
MKTGVLILTAHASMSAVVAMNSLSGTKASSERKSSMILKILVCTS